MTDRATMTPQERERFYDEHVAPVLADLAKRCIQHGLSMLAVVEWTPGEHGRTFALQPGGSYGIRLAEAAAQSGGNVDSLMFAIMKHAREHGHSSAILHELGVPTAPGGRFDA